MVGQDGLRAYADVRYKVYGCAYVPMWVDECLRVLEGYVGGCVGGSVCVCVFAHVCVLLRTLCVCC